MSKPIRPPYRSLGSYPPSSLRAVSDSIARMESNSTNDSVENTAIPIRQGPHHRHVQTQSRSLKKLHSIDDDEASEKGAAQSESSVDVLKQLHQRDDIIKQLKSEIEVLASANQQMEIQGERGRNQKPIKMLADHILVEEQKKVVIMQGKEALDDMQVMLDELKSIVILAKELNQEISVEKGELLYERDELVKDNQDLYLLVSNLEVSLSDAPETQDPGAMGYKHSNVRHFCWELAERVKRLNGYLMEKTRQAERLEEEIKEAHLEVINLLDERHTHRSRRGVRIKLIDNVHQLGSQQHGYRSENLRLQYKMNKVVKGNQAVFDREVQNFQAAYKSLSEENTELKKQLQLASVVEEKIDKDLPTTKETKGNETSPLQSELEDLKKTNGELKESIIFFNTLIDISKKLKCESVVHGEKTENSEEDIGGSQSMELGAIAVQEELTQAKAKIAELSAQNEKKDARIFNLENAPNLADSRDEMEAKSLRRAQKTQMEERC